MISQIFIFIFGGTAIYLVGTTGKWKKYGYLCGLLSQPFWFYAAWEQKQWGIFFICFIYLYSWINGFRNYWFK